MRIHVILHQAGGRGLDARLPSMLYGNIRGDAMKGIDLAPVIVLHSERPLSYLLFKQQCSGNSLLFRVFLSLQRHTVAIIQK